MGEKTFGKGLVQTIMGLPDGSPQWRSRPSITYTAHKNDINHKGILPNVPVTIPDDDLRKDAAFRREHPEALYDLKFDTQLQTALTQVKQQMQVASARPW